MKKVELLNLKGEKVKDINLNEEIFGITPNKNVLHDAIILSMASLRQGTHKTKNRSEVSGGGRKPWRQKGTGRARQGSIRSVQWVGGGNYGTPVPRDYSKKQNRKERQLAVKSMLSMKVLEQSLVVVDKLAFEEIKTKNMVSALNNLKVTGKTLVMLSEKNENVQKSARNIEGVKTTLVNTINVYDLLKYNNLVVTLDTVKKLEEVYA